MSFKISEYGTGLRSRIFSRNFGSEGSMTAYEKNIANAFGNPHAGLGPADMAKEQRRLWNLAMFIPAGLFIGVLAGIYTGAKNYADLEEIFRLAIMDGAIGAGAGAAPTVAYRIIRTLWP